MTKPATSLRPFIEDRGQLQAGDPAFSARFESRHVLCGQIQPHHLIEKIRGLFGGETQIGRAQFDQLVADAQARQRPGWIDARGQYQMQLIWQVIELEREGRMDGLILDDMIVIQDQHQVVFQAGKVIDQDRRDRIVRQRLRRVKQRQCRFA